jgi:hypothetical protein
MPVRSKSKFARSIPPLVIGRGSLQFVLHVFDAANMAYHLFGSNGRPDDGTLDAVGCTAGSQIISKPFSAPEITGGDIR